MPTEIRIPDWTWLHFCTQKKTKTVLQKKTQNSRIGTQANNQCENVFDIYLNLVSSTSKPLWKYEVRNGDLSKIHKYEGLVTYSSLTKKQLGYRQQTLETSMDFVAYFYCIFITKGLSHTELSVQDLWIN